MGVLIDALLDLSRMSRRKMRYEDVDLSRLSRDILRKLKITDPSRPTEFKVADGLVVNGDFELLRVVLENLIGNAWKYTSKCDHTCIEIGYRANQDAAYFVRDNGVGFDMQYADKLFGPFQRLHTVEEFDGMGIGLATVARIIDRHGGRVWAEGVPDRGATFYFTA